MIPEVQRESWHERFPRLPSRSTPTSCRWRLPTAFPGARARTVSIVDAHSGTTGRARLRIDWEKPALAPPVLFGKLAPADPTQQQMVVATGMGKREARFYASVAPDVPVRVPAPYASMWTEDGSSYCMLTEDLAASGCSFPSWSDPEVGEVAGGMMDALAQLHAGFWESPRFSQDLAWIEPPLRSDFGPTLVKAAMEEHADTFPPAFLAMGELYVENTHEVDELLDEGASTLLHGDTHLGNLFVDDGEVGLLDWACTARGPGLRDVAYFLGNSVDSALRRKHEREWVARYLATLEAAGAPAAPFDEAFERYRRLVVTAWVAAAATLGAGNRMQSLDVGTRAVTRATVAISELESLELLRDELGLA